MSEPAFQARMDARLKALMNLPRGERQSELDGLDDYERDEFRYHWNLWARRDQLPPPGDWHTWLICAGRGFGKTRAGAEWVRHIAKREPDARIALVGASLAEVRAVMVEGESGIVACSPPHRCPEWEPSLRRISWPNGAQATIYSAAEPEALRGPQHSHAWCDELAKWEMAGERAVRSWDNLLLGLRLGEVPRVLATTTPRAVPLMKRLMDEQSAGVVVTRGGTVDNTANLPARFLADINNRFGGSAFARQELDGELLAEVDGALWTRELLERCRQTLPGEPTTRVVVGVDPPASARGDACGIVVAGIGASGCATVLADCSVERPTPERWARAVAEAARSWQAERVVAEANQGGAMVESVLRAAELSLPIRLVHASRGKAARAEPVAALYEAGRVRHLSHASISEGDLAAGKFDGARIAIGAVDWETLHRTTLYHGSIGSVSIEMDGFSAELRSAKAMLGRRGAPLRCPMPMPCAIPTSIAPSLWCRRRG